jgi:hypothetical protein
MVQEVKAWKPEGSDELFDSLEAAEVFERDSRVMLALIDLEDPGNQGFVSIQLVMDNLDRLIGLLYAPDGETIYKRLEE